MQTAEQPAQKARVSATDDIGNISYVFFRDGHWRCALSNGISASMHYAGLLGDEMAVRFRLEDAQTANEVLAIIREAGSHRYTYRLV